ncbi:alpha/beta fold hydrolase [Salinibacterium sp. ZJ450]|uniref:alpha/beta fold hydrolase n=1 Tax=Salinibacterium sp. ZJ450 TaxID=2708338 RepID=UPI001422EBFD|nr:alpha/beta hydrolase [Salinibacterium sp. ZJ450]
MESPPAASGVVLLGGAGLHPWIWDAVAPQLSLPALVARYPRTAPPASLRQYAESVLQQIDDSGFSRVVLVGHSIGGVIGTELGSLMRGRVSGFLAIAAVVPKPGHGFVSSLPFPQRLVMGAMLRFAGTKPPADAIRSGLCNGLPTDVADRVVQEFSPESKLLYLDTIDGPLPDVPRGYVRTADDKELPERMQRRFRATLGGAFEAELPTGHLPMLVDPHATAAAINRFLETVRG